MIPPNLEIRGVSRLLVPFRGVTSCRTRQRFLRNGVCRRTGHSDQIEPVMNIRRGRQITHSRFQGLVPHPVLDGPYVETPPTHASGKRGPEGFRSNSLGSRLARSATSLQRLRKFCSRLPVGEGNTNGLSIVTGWLSSNSANSAGTGTSRSSHRFGKNFRSGLDRTRTVLSFGLRSFQNRDMTSCCRTPVNRNVENKARSQESHATRKRDCWSSE